VIPSLNGGGQKVPHPKIIHTHKILGCFGHGRGGWVPRGVCPGRKIMKVILDVEADGLLDTLTTIHCIVMKDIETGVIYRFYDGEERINPEDQSLSNFIHTFNECSSVVGHNIIAYDQRVLGRILNVTFDGKEIIDTLIWSQVLHPDRELPQGCPTSALNPVTGHLDKITPHGVAAWGYRLRRMKPAHYNWDVFSPEMLHRCEEDVEIQSLIYKALLKEIGKKEEWFKVLQLESRVAEIINEQQENGFAFNVDKAKDLISFTQKSQQEIYNSIRPFLTLEVTPHLSEVTKPFKKQGGYVKSVTDWYGEDCNVVSGPFCRVKFTEPDIGSRQKLIKQLLKHGWTPKEFTETGQPKLTVAGVPVETLEYIDGNIGKLIAKWYILGHRQAQTQGFFNHLRPDGRIPARANTCGTNTNRMRHSIIVNIPKAQPNILLGYEMRDLFYVNEGNCLCGHDAAALEARVMAHYSTPIDGGDFAKEILTGDVHSTNTRRWFPEVEGYKKGDEVFDKCRSVSKNIFYALIYGAQPQKLSEMLGCSLKRAKEFFDMFWIDNPGLGILREKVIKIHEKGGWVPGIDGRKVYTRSPHSALNTLFQSAGAIIMKTSMVLLDHWAKKEGIRYLKVADMHDESQAEVFKGEFIIIERLTKADCSYEMRGYEGSLCMEPKLLHDGLTWRAGYSRYGELAVNSIRKAGEVLGVRCALDAEYLLGYSWAECH